MVRPWLGVRQGHGALGHLDNVDGYDGAAHQLLGPTVGERDAHQGAQARLCHHKR